MENTPCLRSLDFVDEFGGGGGGGGRALGGGSTGFSGGNFRKQPTFLDAKWRLKKRAQKFHTDDAHYPDLGSAFDWSFRSWNLL